MLHDGTSSIVMTAHQLLLATRTWDKFTNAAFSCNQIWISIGAAASLRDDYFKLDYSH
jgi:hypothetical protein